MAASKISLVPSELDMELYAGDGVELVLSLTDSSGGSLNVTGAVLAQIRVAVGDMAAAAEFASDITEGATGKVVLSLTGLQTASLIQGAQKFSGVWDMQWTATGS